MRTACGESETRFPKAEFARRAHLPLSAGDKKTKIEVFAPRPPIFGGKTKVFVFKKMIYDDNGTTAPAEPATTPEPATTSPAEETPAA